jgi:signal recognition particle subunit SEC65
MSHFRSFRCLPRRAAAVNAKPWQIGKALRSACSKLTYEVKTRQKLKRPTQDWRKDERRNLV